MPPVVLSVGQCGFDDSRIAAILQNQFQARFERARNAQDALRMVAGKAYALVLVNRVFDGDGESGVDLVPDLCAAAGNVPVMLISDYPDAQQAAVAHGALPGFGKSQLHTPAALELLQNALNARTS